MEAWRKRDQTVVDLNEFDASQTRALATIESDFQTMATWISNIEGLFTDGVTAIDFPMGKWMDLTAQSMLKTDLTQGIGVLGGIAGMIGLDGRPETMLGALLVGGETIEFGYRFVEGLGKNFGFIIPTLSSMSTRARPIKVIKELTTEKKQLQDLYAAIEAAQKGKPEYAQSNSYSVDSMGNLIIMPNRPIDPSTGDYLTTHESMRRVLGGNGSGTIDGLAPYAQGTLRFLFEDIGTLLNPNATLDEKALSAAFMVKPVKMVDTLYDVAKTADKARDVGKANKGIDNPLLPSEGKVGTYEELIDAGTRGDNITPHHMPSAKYMQTKAEVHKNDEVMFGLIHGIGSYDKIVSSEVSLKVLANSIPKMLPHAKEWLKILHKRILNHEISRNIYKEIIPTMNNDIQEYIVSQLTSIKERNPSRFEESVNSILDF